MASRRKLSRLRPGPVTFTRSERSAAALATEILAWITLPSGSRLARRRRTGIRPSQWVEWLRTSRAIGRRPPRLRMMAASARRRRHAPRRAGRVQSSGLDPHTVTSVGRGVKKLFHVSISHNSLPLVRHLPPRLGRAQLGSQCGAAYGTVTAERPLARSGCGHCCPRRLVGAPAWPRR